VSYLRRFGRFWWSFVVGDNLPLALGAGAAIAVTALLVHEGFNAWWLLPTAILAMLAVSVGRVADPDNRWASLRRERKSSALETATSSHTTRDVERLGDRTSAATPKRVRAVADGREALRP
jgi:hypothetical protein